MVGKGLEMRSSFSCKACCFLLKYGIDAKLRQIHLLVAWLAAGLLLLFKVTCHY